MVEIEMEKAVSYILYISKQIVFGFRRAEMELNLTVVGQVVLQVRVVRKIQGMEKTDLIGTCQNTQQQWVIISLFIRLNFYNLLHWRPNIMSYSDAKSIFVELSLQNAAE